ncbi:MAG: carboxypeptidase regulatory-like domain-containing protein [candidate division Zixibacteria bacterium]
MKLAKVNIIRIQVLAILLIVFTGSADALTEKEQWLKDNASSIIIPKIDPPVILEHGGPDAGGYYYIDSDDDAMNAPVYEWVDITDGTLITLDDDDNQGPFDLGFDFEFYGSTFDSLRVCSNGFLSFTSTANYYLNRRIPSLGDPNNLLAVFWDDLSPNNGGQVYYKQDTAPGGGQRFVVSYNGVPHYSNSGALYFQVLLYDSGDIIYQYGSMEDEGHGNNEATIGIEDNFGFIGTEYLFNEDGIHDEMAVYFGQSPPIFADHDIRPTTFNSPGSNIGEVGNPIEIGVQFLNGGANTESFDVRVSILLDGEVYNESYGVFDLPSGRLVDVVFPGFTPTEEGIYELVAISELSNDGIPENDTLRMEYSAFNNIYIENFEDNDGLYVGDNDWEWGIPTSGPNGAYSGEKLWATILDGDYTIGPLLSTLLVPPLELSGNAQLTFWHWYGTESGFDGGNVKISTDDGNSWQIIMPADGYDGILSTSYENPIGGEEAFSGVSNGWEEESFDLNQYSGTSVLLKFDFGSDSSVDNFGWYIDYLIVYGGGGSEPGYISGVVVDLDSGDPVEGAVVTAGIANVETNQDGEYILELFPNTYSVTASAPYHSSITVDDIEVVAGESVTLDFELPAPAIQVDTTPIETALSPGDIIEFSRNVANTGSGDLNFNIALSFGDRRLRVEPEVKPKYNAKTTSRSMEDLESTDTEYSPFISPGNPPTALDFGDELYVFDPQAQANDIGCLGVEFDGSYFWVSGRYPDPGDDIHKLHKFDRDGNYLESYNQGTFSTWGWRDLTWDGSYLYASDENELAVIDPATGSKIGELPMPTSINPPMRALAYDPDTDHFWAANFNSSIVEFDRNGQTIGSYDNAFAAYGMAWDNASADGPWLWVFSQDGTPATQISQFDPRSGGYTGVVFYAVDHGGENDDLAGGACFTTDWDPTTGILFCLVQGLVNDQSADLVQGYEITPFSRWIDVDPMVGLLGPEENINLTITLDFTGDDIIQDSIYQAQIIINNNSPETPVIPVTVDVLSGIDDDNSNLPGEFSLYQNYPNPFNPSTSIKFALPEQSDVTIEIFNILGQKVSTISEGLIQAGFYSVTWDGSSAASGIYYYKISAGDFVNVKKMTLLK